MMGGMMGGQSEMMGKIMQMKMMMQLMGVDMPDPPRELFVTVI